MKHLSTNDQANLEFLMTMPERALYIWYEQASADDRLYAAELLASHLLNIHESNIIHSMVDNEISDLKYAREYLQKFTLKG